MSKNTNRSTIYDVANRAGVSVASVSRVLNGKGYISEKAAKVINKTIEELEYYPSRNARSLKTSKTGQIVLCIPDICNPFYPELARAIQDTLRQHEYHLILYNTDGLLKEELYSIVCINELNADGVIFTSLEFKPQVMKELEKLYCPVVLIGEYNKSNKFSTISSDSKEGACFAVEHLIKQGHSRIAYIGASDDTRSGRERLSGYLEALFNHRIEVDDRLIFKSDITEMCGYEAGKYFLNLDNPPSAIFASSDILAIGVMRYFEANGVEIPQQVSIVGMDDINLSSLIKPGLTSVAIPKFEMGRTAAETIIDKLTVGGEAVHIVHRTRLVVRGSSFVAEVKE